jgi:UDP-3-O-[3-hydroxymyristoyl] glucosamine N-acyltransferase
VTHRFGIEDAVRFVSSDVRIVGNEAASFSRPSSAAQADELSIAWIRPTYPDKQRLLDSTAAAVVVCDDSLDLSRAIEDGKGLIVTSTPKVAFSRIVHGLFVEKPEAGVHATAVIHSDAEIGDDVSIGPHCTVGRATIGDGTTIHGNCHIYDRVLIGRNVTIHAGSVIGGDGFGYERDEDGEVEKFPHVGGVIIEDDVEIHSCVAIDRGSLSDTRIRRGAKIDNLVHVAHNVEVGEGSFVIAHAMLGGSLRIGRNCWIGPGAVLRDNLSVGDGAFIGIGALVVKDVPEGTTQMGAPAREADEYKAMLQAMKRLAASG